jgi:hypothetical protein
MVFNSLIFMGFLAVVLALYYPLNPPRVERDFMGWPSYFFMAGGIIGS